MRLLFHFSLAFSLLVLLVGCKSAQKPAPQPAMPQQTETMPPPESQANMENNPEPAPPMEEAVPPEHHVHHYSESTPHLGSLHAAYNARAGTLTVVVTDKILFATGSTKIKTEGHEILDRIASAIRHQYAGHRVYVDGHTDSTPIRSGRWANNHELAAQRALAVADYLMKHGIHESQIVIRSYGAINPRRTAEASRRVEIVVVVH